MNYSLSDLNVGETAQIVNVSNSYPTYRKKLLALGLLPGTLLKVIGQAPFGDPLKIELNGFTLSLRKTESTMVQVKK